MKNICQREKEEEKEENLSQLFMNKYIDIRYFRRIYFSRIRSKLSRFSRFSRWKSKLFSLFCLCQGIFSMFEQEN